MRKIMVVLLLSTILLVALFWGVRATANAFASDEGTTQNLTDIPNASTSVIISGTINGPGGGVPGVIINIYSGSNQYTAITNASGFYTASIAESPQVTFRIRPPIDARLAQVNHLVEDIAAHTTLNFTVTAGSLLSVLPVDSSNQPITDTIRLETLPLQEDRSVVFWWYELDWDAVSQSFQAVLPKDIVYIRIYQVPEGYYQTFVSFDLRSNDRIENIPLNTHDIPLLPTDPPDAGKITIGPPDGLGEATITGTAGAALPLMRIFVNNLNSYHQAYTISEADGSFSTRIYAPPGSNILVKQGPAGSIWYGLSKGSPGGNITLLPGTILYVPHTLSAAPGDLPFAAVGAAQKEISTVSSVPDTHNYVGAAWAMQGILHLVDETTYQVTSTLRFYGPAITTTTDLDGIHIDGVGLSLFMQHNAAGQQQGYKNRFMSTMLSPSGLPIEMMGKANLALNTPVQIGNWRHTGDHIIEGDLTFTLVITDAPSGIYRPVISFPSFEAGATGIPTDTTWVASAASDFTGGCFEAFLPPITVGEVDQPRLAWYLLANNWTQGQRGIGAIEDRGNFGLVSEIVTQGDIYYLPPVDERNGEVITYRLEPFLPMISYTDRKQPGPPLLPFDLPGGELYVVIQKPSGEIIHLGPEPFAQSLSRTPSTYTGSDHNIGTQQLDDIYNLQAGTDSFEFVFDQYGQYVITMTGMIQDVWGNNYLGGGTYKVWAAQPLDIDPGVLPGTPLAVGDAFNPTLQFYPRLPAQVDLRLSYYDSWGTTQPSVQRLQGSANRFGNFSSPITTSLVMTQPGEYRLDLVARYTDLQGKLYMGAMTWGGVVMTPPEQAQLIAHGRRGYDVGVNDKAWFVGLRDIVLLPSSVSHLHATYFPGDIVWSRMEDGLYGDSLILNPSLQDTTGGVWSDLILQRANDMNFLEPMPPNDLITRFDQGEIPLFFSTFSGHTPLIDPNGLDQVAYAYEYSQRPGVRVREYLGEDNMLAYWRLDTTYDNQLGDGIAGDIENDFKFQYMGMVFHDIPSGHSEYLGYGSSWVFLPDDDPLGSRVMPPFSGPGNGGWTTDGGPIMTLKGQDIHIFIYPTGVQPGAVLQVGDPFRFAGHINPTLPSQVAIAVTAPSGAQFTGGGQANSIGYFYNPANDFIVNEPGWWSVDVHVWHDGACSAGSTIPPYPQGDVLGSTNGRYWFYVVRDDAPKLNVATPQPGYLHFGDQVTPIIITGTLPSGLSNVQVDYTIHMPGFILEHGQATISGSTYQFVFDPATLAQDFPNLDLTARGDRVPGLSDTFSISIAAKGNAGGQTIYRANVITIQGQQVYVDSQPPEILGTSLFLPLVLR